MLLLLPYVDRFRSLLMAIFWRGKSGHGSETITLRLEVIDLTLRPTTKSHLLVAFYYNVLPKSVVRVSPLRRRPAVTVNSVGKIGLVIS